MAITEFVLKNFWKVIQKKDAARMAKQSLSEGVSTVCDIPYSDDGDKMHLLDVYSPSVSDAPLPVILEIHGGGWTYGDKDLNKIYATFLASRGFSVVNISYRLLAKGVGLKEELQDVFAACNWLYKNGAEYNFDLNNIFVNGDSAGGHLAAVTAAVALNPNYQKLLGVSAPFSFRAVGCSSGAIALEKYDNVMLLSGLRRMFFGKKPKQSALFVFNSPSLLIDKNTYPPIYLVSSDKDFIKSHSFAFEQFCIKNDLVYEFSFTKQADTTNKLEHVYDVLYPTWDESKKAIDGLCAFFKRFIS
ncbi:MAG: alpha/beta hydrolase [Christensenellaceae bacterium]|jgi:acetyl esterase/lipase|nr:alpha/beta hydrolase [Christensenellaceae bacterium]